MSNLPAPLNEADYEAIESAVMETARGRWFLAEFARRNRAADTNRLLEAIERLYNAAVQSRETVLAEHIQSDLEDMRRSIEETRRDIAAIKPREGFGNRPVAANDLETLASSAERATMDILAAVERLQRTAEVVEPIVTARERHCEQRRHQQAEAAKLPAGAAKLAKRTRLKASRREGHVALRGLL